MSQRFCRHHRLLWSSTRTVATAANKQAMEIFQVFKNGPGFGVSASQVKVLTEPSQYYDKLVSLVQGAERRISIASLYLGTGDKSENLVNVVKKRLHEKNGDVQLRVVLDHSRGTRLSSGQTSCSMLLPLVQDYKDSCRVSLYHTPNLRGLLKKTLPARFKESVGVQHIKIFAVDNSVVISGANLSEDYFTNRQDRYVVVEDCEPLADYCHSLVDRISTFSLRLTNQGSFNQDDRWQDGHPYEGSFDKFTKSVKNSLTQFQNDFAQKHSPSTSCENKSDTWIFPTLQLGVCDVRGDSRTTTDFLRSGAPGSSFKFATGYFNLIKDYQNVLINESASNFDLVMAHPKANGFYQAKGPAGGIPPAYTLITKQFFDKVKQKNGSADRIKLFEYQRSGWTFHGKGLWYYLPQSKNRPIATMVGSPNFGFRSVEKDLEAQFTIVTTNEQLQDVFHKEYDNMFKWTNQVNDNTFNEEGRHIPLWVRGVVLFFRNLF